MTRTKNVKIFQIIFVRGDSLYLDQIKGDEFFCMNSACGQWGRKKTNIDRISEVHHELGTTVHESMTADEMKDPVLKNIFRTKK